MFFYNLVLLIHIFAAIFALGPSVIIKFLFATAKSNSELKKALEIRSQAVKLMMVCGGLLLITGLALGFMNPILFKVGWYHASLTAFLIAIAIGPIFISKIMKKVKVLLDEQTGEEIPKEYYALTNKAKSFINLQNSLYIIVLILMVLKPF